MSHLAAMLSGEFVIRIYTGLLNRSYILITFMISLDIKLLFCRLSPVADLGPLCPLNIQCVKSGFYTLNLYPNTPTPLGQNIDPPLEPFLILFLFFYESLRQCSYKICLI